MDDLARDLADQGYRTRLDSEGSLWLASVIGDVIVWLSGERNVTVLLRSRQAVDEVDHPRVLAAAAAASRDLDLVTVLLDEGEICFRSHVFAASDGSVDASTVVLAANACVTAARDLLQSMIAPTRERRAAGAVVAFTGYAE